MALASARHGTPFLVVGLAESLRWPPWLLGLACAALVFGLSVALDHLLGWQPSVEGFGRAFWSSPRGWFEALTAVTIGYLLAAMPFLVRGAQRDAAELGPHLAQHEPACAAQLEGLARFGGAGLAAADLLGIAVGLSINFLPGQWLEGRPALTDSFFLYATARTVVLTWALARTAFVDVQLARRFSRLGAHARVEDLFERGGLAAFGRQGLRSVLVWMGLSVLLSAMALAPFGRGAVGVGLLATAAVAGAALFWPVAGVHRRLEAARQSELARLRQAIRRRVRGVAHEGDGPGRGELSLADLLALEARFERVGTWPFDAAAWLRFTAYVGIGLGSWVGAALVERVLGAALA